MTLLDGCAQSGWGPETERSRRLPLNFNLVRTERREPRDRAFAASPANIDLWAHSNCRNLNFQITRQARYLDCRSCRRGHLEVSSVDLIHFSELIHILQEHGG